MNQKNNKSQKKSKDLFLILSGTGSSNPQQKAAAKNAYYRLKAKDNKVTDLGSFIDEIKYRFMGNPYLGGDSRELSPFKLGETLNKLSEPEFKLSKIFNLDQLFNFNNLSNTKNRVIQKQQGGTMNNQEELQKAFLQFLVQDAAAQGIQLQSEQDLQSYAEQLGEEGIKAKYQQFMQMMQKNSMKAKLGAKLTYYKKLKGICPDGEELSYYKIGGRVCKACQKISKDNADENLNIIQKFKKGKQKTKMKE